MSADFWRWEVDPLFAAAEEVQDSVDRLESAFRTWNHLTVLARTSSTLDQEATSMIEFRQRKLLTTLGTAKWQMEEFERAVRQADSEDHPYTGEEDAPARHAQFVKAIASQIDSIENSLQSSPYSEDFKVVPGLGRDAKENDELASFLSGANSTSEPIVEEGDVRINLPNQEEGNDEATSSDSREFKIIPLVEKLPVVLNGGFPIYSTSEEPNNPSSVLQVKDGMPNGQLLSHMERGEIVISTCFSETNDNTYFDEERRKEPSERTNDYRRSASVGSGLNNWGYEDLEKRKLIQHARSEAPAVNGFSFFGLLNMNYAAEKLRVSKSGFKRWKDGDATSRDSEKMHRYIDTGLESRNTRVTGNMNGLHMPTRNICVKEKPWLVCGGSLQRHLQLSHALPCSRLVQLASTILVALGLVGLLSFCASL